MIYRFTTKQTFNRLTNSDLKFFKDDKRALFFMKVPGFPNPWYVYRIKNGKVDKSKLISPEQLDGILRRSFRKKA